MTSIITLISPNATGMSHISPCPFADTVSQWDKTSKNVITKITPTMLKMHPQ